MKIGVFVGRLSPPHIGHQRIIDRMIEERGIENCVCFLGSSVSPMTWRNLFNYNERCKWVKILYPNLRVVGIPDTIDNNNYMWCDMLEDYIAAIFPTNSGILYYSGSKIDAAFYHKEGVLHKKRETRIIDRSIIDVSASKIRHRLEKGKSIKGLVDKLIIEDVTTIFNYNYENIITSFYET